MSTETVDLSPYAEDGVKDNAWSLDSRVPIITTSHPRWCYITAVVVDDWLAGGVIPDDRELTVVASFHQEYIDYWYRKGGQWWADLQAHPFDMDGAAVGRYLIKYPSGGWGYRRSTWEYGPLFSPPSTKDPVSLVDVLDRCHGHGEASPSPRWQQWKADHAEIFAGADT